MKGVVLGGFILALLINLVMGLVLIVGLNLLGLNVPMSFMSIVGAWLVILALGDTKVSITLRR